MRISHAYQQTKPYLLVQQSHKSQEIPLIMRPLEFDPASYQAPVMMMAEHMQKLDSSKTKLNGLELAAILYRNAESLKQKPINKPLAEVKEQVEVSPTRSGASIPLSVTRKTEPAKKLVDEQIWARWRACPEASEPFLKQDTSSKHSAETQNCFGFLEADSISPSQSASCRNRHMLRKPLRLEDVWEVDPEEERERELWAAMEKPVEGPPLASTESSSSASIQFPDAYQAPPLSEDMSDLWREIRRIKCEVEIDRLEAEKDRMKDEARELRPKPLKPRPIFAVSEVVQDKLVEKIVAKNDNDTPYALPRCIVDEDAAMESVAYNLSLAIDLTTTAEGLSRIYRLYLFPLASNIGVLCEGIRGAHLARRRQFPSMRLTQDKCEALGFPFEPLQGHEPTEEEEHNSATGTTKWKTSDNKEISLNDNNFVVYTFGLETSVDIYLLQTYAEVSNLTGMNHGWIAGFLDMHFVTEATLDEAMLIWQLSAADCVADRLRMDTYIPMEMEKRNRDFFGYFFVRDEVTLLRIDALDRNAYDRESKLGIVSRWGKYKLTEPEQLQKFLKLHGSFMKFGFREMNDMIMGGETQKAKRKVLDFGELLRRRRGMGVQTTPTVVSEESEWEY